MFRGRAHARVSVVRPHGSRLIYDLPTGPQTPPLRGNIQQGSKVIAARSPSLRLSADRLALPSHGEAARLSMRISRVVRFLRQSGVAVIPAPRRGYCRESAPFLPPPFLVIACGRRSGELPVRPSARRGRLRSKASIGPLGVVLRCRRGCLHRSRLAVLGPNRYAGVSKRGDVRLRG